MNKTMVLPGLLALGFVLCLVAQSEADYSGWMKEVGATKGKVTKGIAAKQNADVATDAAHLAELYKQVGAFWAGRKVGDAEAIAKKGETSANELAAAAKDGDEAKMQTSLQAVNGTCGACHSAHREGSAGSYKMK